MTLVKIAFMPLEFTKQLLSNPNTKPQNGVAYKKKACTKQGRVDQCFELILFLELILW